ncbi:carbohydrate ABC transporter permease [Nonomuraea diastatica]|uniref:Sugar ABC transporter permease n=1 Tax=Nonomuraea diastatica TaxID=1848329 RepID=A0A4R4WF24_9ACTN|nr:sugar ABC transporter permease [Nonomuraea diastatica]TDD15897.1 sugar ABC transporter permease [Nonomuraea diastatica]
MRRGRPVFIAGFLAAPVLIYAVLVIGPYLQAFQIALTNWRGVSARANYVGLDNFFRIFQDDMFWKALRNHGQMLLAVPLITICLALTFAFLLNVGGRRRTGLRGSAFYRVVFFFPQVLSLAAVGVLFQLVYRPDESGVLNRVIVGLGLEPLGFLTNPSLALWSIMGVMIWAGVGFYMVLFSAGMAAIPTEIYEAAELDGAGRFRVFFSITLPLLRNTVQVAWVYLGIVVLDGFALVQVLSINNGGPDGATSVLGLQVWQHAFGNYTFGYASAMGVVLFFIIMSISALTMRLTRRESLEY